MGIKSYRTLNIGNTIIPIKLVKTTTEKDFEPTFEYVCPECELKPIRKHFCEKCNKEVFPKRKFFAEQKENDTISIIGTIESVNPFGIESYYYITPTTIKGSKVVEDTTGKNRDFRRLFIFLMKNNMKLEGNCVLTTHEKKIILFATNTNLVMGVLADKVNEVNKMQVSEDEIKESESEEFVPLRAILKKPIAVRQ